MTLDETIAHLKNLLDAFVEEQLESTEIMLRDKGATDDELFEALGPHGFVRERFLVHRDAEMKRLKGWLEREGHSLQ